MRKPHHSRALDISREVLGALASALPASKSLLELQLAMQRRCPAQVPNLLAATVLTLLALVALLCAEAAWSWRKEDEELEQKAAKSDLIQIKPAFQSFKSGISRPDTLIQALN